MIETRRFKNVVMFLQTIVGFLLSRKIMNMYNDLAQKDGNVTVKDFRKYEKLEYKNDKLKLDIDFLNNCKQLGVYPKLFISKLPNVSNKDASSIRKILLRSAINNRNKELSKPENFISKQLSTIDFYTLKKSITSHNKKSLQKSLYTQQKHLSSLTRVPSYLYSQLTKLLLTLCNMNYLRKKLIYLKQVYNFQFNQTKFENPISSLPSKRFIVL